MKIIYNKNDVKCLNNNKYRKLIKKNMTNKCPSQTIKNILIP